MKTISSHLPTFLGSFVLLFSPCMEAHIPSYGVGTLSRIIFKETKLLITFDLSYDGFWSQGEMIQADSDKDSKVGEDEAGAYIKKQWAEKIAPRLHAKVDGEDAPLVKVAERHEGLVGEIYPVPFSLYYELEVEIRGLLPGADHTFELEDLVVRDETPAKPFFVVPYKGHGSKEGVRFNPQFLEPDPAMLDIDGYRLEGSRLRVKFSFDELAETAGPSPEKEEPSKENTLPENAKSRSQASQRALESDSSRKLMTIVENYRALSGWALVGGMLLALFLGAGHALEPGHGKAMVAAYLIGTRGRVRDAVILGLVTTITHMGSVFLFGIAIFIIVGISAGSSQGALQNRVIVGTQFVSSCLLVFLGIALFFRRMRGPGHGHSHHHHDHHHLDAHHQDHHHDDHEHHHHHHHGHQHDHHHDHGHEHHHHEALRAGHASRPSGLLQGGAPRLRDLVALGFSGGIVPCPAGLAVIFVSLHRPQMLLPFETSYFSLFATHLWRPAYYLLNSLLFLLNFWFPLFLLLFFSIGVGSVLIGIGVFLITGKALAAGRAREGAFFQEMAFLERHLPKTFLEFLDRCGLKVLRILPVLSSLFIAALGAFFCVSTYRIGKTELAAILRAVASWLE